jgi:hypothetical protein
MFAKTFSETLVLLGLRHETIPAPELEELEEPEEPSIDIGCLDLNDPRQAFDALRRVVAMARAEQRQERAPGRLDLAA